MSMKDHMKNIGKGAAIGVGVAIGAVTGVAVITAVSLGLVFNAVSKNDPELIKEIQEACDKGGKQEFSKNGVTYTITCPKKEKPSV